MAIRKDGKFNSKDIWWQGKLVDPKSIKGTFRDTSLYQMNMGDFNHFNPPSPSNNKLPVVDVYTEPKVKDTTPKQNINDRNSQLKDVYPNPILRDKNQIKTQKDIYINPAVKDNQPTLGKAYDNPLNPINSGIIDQKFVYTNPLVQDNPQPLKEVYTNPTSTENKVSGDVYQNPIVKDNPQQLMDIYTNPEVKDNPQPLKDIYTNPKVQDNSQPLKEVYTNPTSTENKVSGDVYQNPVVEEKNKITGVKDIYTNPINQNKTYPLDNAYQNPNQNPNKNTKELNTLNQDNLLALKNQYIEAIQKNKNLVLDQINDNNVRLAVENKINGLKDMTLEEIRKMELGKLFNVDIVLPPSDPNNEPQKKIENKQPATLKRDLVEKAKEKQKPNLGYAYLPKTFEEAELQVKKQRGQA